MGWKTSMIIIEIKDHEVEEGQLLKALGRENYQFIEECSLEECMVPNDESINIGYYNGNLIICDDFQVTNNTLGKAKSLDLTTEEKNLTELFPDSEIISVACHSVVNYHGYSLIQNGKKVRIKAITSDTALEENGERTPEEEEIYKTSYSRDGQNFWKYEEDPDEEFAESEMMEDFTFKFAKRRLGVQLDLGEADELFNKVRFKKFLPGNKPKSVTKTAKESKWNKWRLYILIFILLIAWRLFKRLVLEK